MPKNKILSVVYDAISTVSPFDGTKFWAEAHVDNGYRFERADEGIVIVDTKSTQPTCRLIPWGRIYSIEYQMKEVTH